MLQTQFPATRIRVLNRGVGGEHRRRHGRRGSTRDVLAEQPDLVIWQVGTNGVLRRRSADHDGERFAGVATDAARGRRRDADGPAIRAGGTGHPRYRDMLRGLAATAAAADVPLFPRFAMMRHWAETGRCRCGDDRATGCT